MQKIKNIFHFFEIFLGAVVFGFPGKKMKIIGVTGTDGKTTTVNLIHHILTVAGYKTGIFSTLSSAHTTTPGRWYLQKFLKQCLDNGCTHVVLEVSSIAIDQHRVWGIDFEIGVLTNIANNEHLDYHKTYENYKKIKEDFLQSCKQTVRWEDYKDFSFETKLIGEFNRENCLAAIGAAKVMGIDDDTIRRAVLSFKAPSGRLEVVVRKPFMVIVDFAHTPQAFEKVLPEVKKLGKRLIHVFGCTGDRDKTKRPLMGEIASKYDDVIILTHEDTYSEDREKIIDDIEKGIPPRHPGIFSSSWREPERPIGSTKKILSPFGLQNDVRSLQHDDNYYRISDRKEAIKKALEMAKPGDVVIITGVGHQKSLNIGGKEVPWSDQKTVKELLSLPPVSYKHQ